MRGELVVVPQVCQVVTPAVESRRATATATELLGCGKTRTKRRAANSFASLRLRVNIFIGSGFRRQSFSRLGRTNRLDSVK